MVARLPFVSPAVNPPRETALTVDSLPNAAVVRAHLSELAAAPNLIAGAPTTPANLAAEIERHLGLGPAANRWGKCYARTSQAIFARHHVAEYVRIMKELAVGGRVTLKSGQVIEIGITPQCTEVSDFAGFLWGHMVNNLRPKELANPLRTVQAAYPAGQGEMANVMTRLTGERHVNVAIGGGVDAPNAAAVLAIVARRGPMLAEYGNHGGSVVGTAHGRFDSLELGGAHVLFPSVGYVVLPAIEVERAGLQAVPYAPANPQGYLDPAGLSGLTTPPEAASAEPPGG
jgi:hypothetical protein